MATRRENSRNFRSGHPTRSPTHKNWSGGVMYNSHVGTSQKITCFALLVTNKIGKSIFMWQLQNPSYESCWHWKDAHVYQKWGQYLKVC
jgi:hypothetical protein